MVVRRFCQLVLGLTLYGFANALMIQGGLGLSPWSALHQGISRAAGISFGTASILTGMAVLLLWVPLKQRIGIGTILNVAILGPATDASLLFIPAPQSIVDRLLLMIIGIVLTGMSSGLYIGAGFEPGPRDGLMTGLAKRTSLSIRLIRTAIEISVLVTGFILGGTVGFGTLAFALMIGPLVQISLARFDRRRPASVSSSTKTACAGAS